RDNICQPSFPTRRSSDLISNIPGRQHGDGMAPSFLECSRIGRMCPCTLGLSQREAKDEISKASRLMRAAITGKMVRRSATLFKQDRKSTRLNSSHVAISY